MAMKKEKKKKKKYSYIRKSYSRNGWYSLGIGILVLLLSIIAIWISVYDGGRAGMLASSVGLSAILFAIMGLWFTRLAFMETGRDMLYARLGGIVSFIVLMFWIIIML